MIHMLIKTKGGWQISKPSFTRYIEELNTLYTSHITLFDDRKHDYQDNADVLSFYIRRNLNYKVHSTRVIRLT